MCCAHLPNSSRSVHRSIRADQSFQTKIARNGCTDCLTFSGIFARTVFTVKYEFHGKRGNILSEANNECPFLAAMPSRQHPNHGPELGFGFNKSLKKYLEIQIQAWIFRAKYSETIRAYFLHGLSEKMHGLVARNGCTDCPVHGTSRNHLINVFYRHPDSFILRLVTTISNLPFFKPF